MDNNEKSERRKQLDETVKQFNKDHKSEVISKGDDIENLPSQTQRSLSHRHGLR